MVSLTDNELPLRRSTKAVAWCWLAMGIILSIALWTNAVHNYHEEMSWDTLKNLVPLLVYALPAACLLKRSDIGWWFMIAASAPLTVCAAGSGLFLSGSLWSRLVDVLYLLAFGSSLVFLLLDRPSRWLRPLAANEGVLPSVFPVSRATLIFGRIFIALAIVTVWGVLGSLAKVFEDAGAIPQAARAIIVASTVNLLVSALAAYVWYSVLRGRNDARIFVLGTGVLGVLVLAVVMGLTQPVVANVTAGRSIPLALLVKAGMWSWQIAHLWLPGLPLLLLATNPPGRLRLRTRVLACVGVTLSLAGPWFYACRIGSQLPTDAVAANMFTAPVLLLWSAFWFARLYGSVLAWWVLAVTSPFMCFLPLAVLLPDRPHRSIPAPEGSFAASTRADASQSDVPNDPG